MAPMEYAIPRNLDYYREGGSEKQIHDIAGVIEISEFVNKSRLHKNKNRGNETSSKMASHLKF
jgi:hypothetical protein